MLKNYNAAGMSSVKPVSIPVGDAGRAGVLSRALTYVVQLF